MLAQFITTHFLEYWGPLRLLSSITFLSAMGTALAGMMTLFLLPRLWHLVTQDKGRAHAHNAEASIGKPLGVGIFIILTFAILVLLLVPFDAKLYLCALAVVAASIVGLVDDIKPGGLSELTLGLADLVLALFACVVIFYDKSALLWLPFISQEIELPFWAAVLVYTPVIWLSVNALNCSDGVDGLSGTISTTTLAALGLLLYFVVGHIENSRYLLIPFNPEAVNWVIAISILCGAIVGYLWYNAPPSAALMGDAGSRPIGLFIGMCVAVSGNPILVLFVGFMILANGATGLFKVGLIRVFRIHILTSVIFPLHDHVRRKLHWSNSQVLVRFMLIHIATIWILMLILLKMR